MSGQLPPGSQAANTSSQQPPTGSKQTNVSPISMSPPHRTLLPVVFGTALPLLTMIPSQMLSQVPTTPAGGGISPSPDPNTNQWHNNLSNNLAS
ncbi:hypothetical protein PCANC_18419 [Puccinia coronata f. sp. avenae]|uniref:Uncharacterized protein n=1 Tax=Puccinia coronata f. sp. avenae TaxID=200324 RepID=A0A2N5SK65_9BASI|nr:hypothetical protein PCANC_18419 [Puccinia coronata f. sp. avenae]